MNGYSARRQSRADRSCKEEEGYRRRQPTVRLLSARFVPARVSIRMLDGSNDARHNDIAVAVGRLEHFEGGLSISAASNPLAAKVIRSKEKHVSFLAEEETAANRSSTSSTLRRRRRRRRRRRTENDKLRRKRSLKWSRRHPSPRGARGRATTTSRGGQYYYYYYYYYSFTPRCSATTSSSLFFSSSRTQSFIMSFGVEGKILLSFSFCSFFCCCCWRLGVFGHFISKIRLIKNLKTHNTQQHNTQHTTHTHKDKQLWERKRRRRRRFVLEEEEEEEEDYYTRTLIMARGLSRDLLAGEKRHQVEERPGAKGTRKPLDAAAKSGERRARYGRRRKRKRRKKRRI